MHRIRIFADHQQVLRRLRLDLLHKPAALIGRPRLEE